MDQVIEFVGNHYILSLGWVAIFIALVMSFVKSAFSAVKYLSPNELTLAVNRNDALVVDIRTRKEFTAGHIAGSRHIEMEKFHQNDFSALEKEKNKPIIVVCMAGVTASGVASKLVKQGFESVSLLQGGMNAWIGAGLPIVKSKK